ncbi:MAG: hypothetical protein KC668_11235 [Myxococcales bacterium]|nr:hypothetical protein [Myxococcales bacterium]
MMLRPASRAREAPASSLSTTPLALAALAGLVVVWASPVTAQQVEWSPSSDTRECISARLLRERVQRAASEPLDDRLVLRLAITREERIFHVTLTVADDAGLALSQRELTVPALRCQELDDTIVLVSVLMLEAADLRRRHAPNDALRRDWHAGVSGGATVRTVPTPQPDVGLALRWSKQRLALQLRAFASGEAGVPAAEGSIRLRSMGMEARLCARGGPFGASNVLTLGPCAAVSLGQLRGRAVGLAMSSPLRNAHARLGVGFEAAIRAGAWLLLVPSLTADVALTRASYRVSQSGTPNEAYRTPLFGVRAELALMVRIGGAR